MLSSAQLETIDRSLRRGQVVLARGRHVSAVEYPTDGPPRLVSDEGPIDPVGAADVVVGQYLLLLQPH